MGIEHEIQVKGFKTEWHKLTVNLLFSSAWLEKGIHKVLQPFGLTQKQFNVLRIVKGHKGKVPLSVLEVRERMIDKMSDASRMIDRMHAKGVVRKYPCSKDKRASRIEITEKGLALLQDVEEKFDDLEGLVKNLSEDEARIMNRLLDKMREK